VTFTNEALTDFTDQENIDRYRSALTSVQSEFGTDYPLIIGDRRIETGDWIESHNPGRIDQLVGRSTAATADHVDQALAAAWTAFRPWAGLTMDERCGLVRGLADVFRTRRFELAAWMTVEAGKNFAEADADVAEAIDFCEYYADQEPLLAGEHQTYPWRGEDNTSMLVPLGAGVVISPWNFPLAIFTGMAVGPAAVGNTLVLKPSPDTPVVAQKLMECAAAAGFPPGVFNLVTGRDADIGDPLVDHPRTRFINFTGSKEVGLRIAERSARVGQGQTWLKRAYMEMGGKDAIIVDDTADLDAAADGVVRSAFGFQGQKCSACSRLIVFESVHDALLDRVVERAALLSVGPAGENHPMGPVISAAQRRSILEEIERGKGEASLVMGGQTIDIDGGYYIEPTVFDGVAPDARLAQHEIFGPVLSVISVGDFDQALAVANGTEFGLTGGIYSADEQRLDRAMREFHVGNLYLNRKITGALVGIQPFGGFNMSGSNAKAGGPDYLRLFMEMKTVAVRRDSA
jgi:1-pyrroline-5-carboxylate dehydrogenase